jgi:hypothetical protein
MIERLVELVRQKRMKDRRVQDDLGGLLVTHGEVRDSELGSMSVHRTFSSCGARWRWSGAFRMLSIAACPEVWRKVSSFIAYLSLEESHRAVRKDYV